MLFKATYTPRNAAALRRRVARLQRLKCRIDVALMNDSARLAAQQKAVVILDVDQDVIAQATTAANGGTDSGEAAARVDFHGKHFYCAYDELSNVQKYTGEEQPREFKDAFQLDREQKQRNAEYHKSIFDARREHARQLIGGAVTTYRIDEIK